MRISIVAQVLLSACLGAEVLAKAPSMRNARKYKEHLQQREGRHGSFKKPVEKRQSKQFLTNATAPFAVDSSQLPNMTFAHIGESYAGLLPMDSSDKELFFWFVPTENPDASDEIVIWLNGGPGCSSLDGFLHENGLELRGRFFYTAILTNHLQASSLDARPIPSGSEYICMEYELSPLLLYD